MGLKDRHVRAVILAGGGDFGRCPLETRIPSSLWFGVNGTVLQDLVNHLHAEGICGITICTGEENGMIEKSLQCPSGVKMRFQPEPFPLGTAGCLREAARNDPADVYLILHVNLIDPPVFSRPMEDHQRQCAEFSVVLHNEQDVSPAESAGIYIAESSVIGCISTKGYCDIKEGLIPSLLAKGKTVHAIEMNEKVFLYQDWTGYLQALLGAIHKQNKNKKELPDGNGMISNSSHVGSGVRIIGPVVIREEVEIGEGCVIVGPAMIGKHSRIGNHTLIDRSIIWADSQIGSGCVIQESVVASQVCVPDQKNIQGELVVSGAMADRRAGESMPRQILEGLTGWLARLDEMLLKCLGKKESARQTWPKITLLVLVLSVGWAYWPIWKELWQIWKQSDEYSSGMLVPILAGYAVWSRRDSLRQIQIRPSWMGLWILLPSFLLYIAGMYLGMASLERYSLVAAIVGLGGLLLGTPMMQKVRGAAFFLLLMLPLPRSLEASITLPLQGWATASAVFCLETLGYAPMRDGHIIQIGNITVAIAEACNGLRMITAFYVISGFVILILRREWWEKAVLLLTTLPVALICNTIRLTATSIAFTFLSGEQWQMLFHDYGGYAMMPLALGAIVAQLWLMRLVIPPEEMAERIQSVK